MKLLKKLFQKKKGAVMLNFLWLMVFWFIFMLIVLNYVIQYGVYHRVNIAAQDAAKMRATAIDMPAKETNGEVWIMYRGRTPSVNSGGAHAVYNTKSDLADQLALQAAEDYIGTFSGKNDQGNKIISTTPQICFDYADLPDTGTATVNFSCQFPDHSWAKENNVTLTSVADNTKGNIGVHNVVFVGIKVTENPVFTLHNLLPGGGVSGDTYVATAIAYPQIDECVNGVTGCSY